MTILSKEVLCKHGPYMTFVDLSSPYKVHANDWPDLSKHQDDIFFEFSDDLVSLYCNVTRTFWFFDPYYMIQIEKSHEIQELSAKFLGLAQNVARIRPFDLEGDMERYSIYSESSLDQPGAKFTGEDLRLDLFETALFIAGRLAKIAHSNRVLYIDGI